MSALPDMTAVCEIFALNTRLLLNCLDGVSDADANRRVLPGTNSMAFVTAHVVDARHVALTLLDRPMPNPLAGTLGKVARIEDVEEMPALASLRASWLAVSAALERCLEGATAESLRKVSPQPFPVGDPSLLGGLAFLAQHEAYHVGQLALMRKGLGYPAMLYVGNPT